MKKKQVEDILGKQTKRLKRIIQDVILVIILFVVSNICLFLYYYNNRPSYVKYTENSDLDYKVYLKDNDFFDNNYLLDNNQYIASLIDYIDASFIYDLKINNKNINYKYQYYIEADVSVKDNKTNKNLYNYKEILSDLNTNFVNSGQDAKIKEKIRIDYNKYNNQIKKFVNVYDLKDSYSLLKINLYVKVLGNCDNSLDKNALLSIDIPLTTQTVSINLNENLIMDNSDNLIFCYTGRNRNYMYLFLGILSFVVDIILAITCLIYEKNTRTAETIYAKRLRKILNNYKSYIQKVNNDFNFVDYQVLKVDTFDDMLEIRDITQEPILMIENQSKTGVYFLIPSKTKILYSYGLKVSKIKEEINEK